MLQFMESQKVGHDSATELNLAKGLSDGITEDEMVGLHHRLNGHGFGWTLAVGDGQGGLECCRSWGWKELDTTE